MVRGKTWFRCPSCGKVFEDLDVEWNATALSMPIPCPECGTMSPAIGKYGKFINLIQKWFARKHEKSSSYNPDKDYLLKHLTTETHVLAESVGVLRNLYDEGSQEGETVEILGATVFANDAYYLAMLRRKQGYFYVAGSILDFLVNAKYPSAFLGMADLYRNGLGVVADMAMADKLEKNAISIWEERASAGDAEALFDMGICYRQGEGVPQDNSKAVEYYTRAYEKGYKAAALNLGLMYGEGIGVKQDFAKAYELYKIAAENGIPDGFTLMGRQHYYGIGREVNYNEAVRLFLKAAEDNEGDALYHLGCCYANGYGVDRDNEKAIECFYLSADAGTKESEQVLLDNGYPYPRETDKDQR